MSAPLSSVAVPGVPPPAASQGFVIAGTAYSYDSVARLLSRLALVPDLNTVTLTSTGSGAAPGATGGGSGGGVQFNISAAIKGAPAPPAPAVIPPAPIDTTTGSTS
jgi:hypothetical protein